VAEQKILNRIDLIRGQKVMLDRDLAEMYGVETKVFNQSVKRNAERFPKDFMFTLSEKEWENLRSQIETSSWGGTRYRPNVFTGQVGENIKNHFADIGKMVEIGSGVEKEIADFALTRYACYLITQNGDATTYSNRLYQASCYKDKIIYT
jgi:ORF6N domain.